MLQNCKLTADRGSYGNQTVFQIIYQSAYNSHFKAGEIIMDIWNLHPIRCLQEKDYLHPNSLDKWKNQNCLGRYCCLPCFNMMPSNSQGKRRRELLLSASTKTFLVNPYVIHAAPGLFETRSQKTIRSLKCDSKGSGFLQERRENPCHENAALLLENDSLGVLK